MPDRYNGLVFWVSQAAQQSTAEHSTAAHSKVTCSLSSLRALLL